MESFLTDELGEEITEELTFEELVRLMDRKHDVYEVIGVGDSLVRERIFSGLETAMQNAGYNTTYDDIYNAWLNRKTIGK